jgi:hypothetical protein
LDSVVVRPAGTAFRSFIVLFVTGLWVAFSGWMPTQRVGQERERTSASAGQHAGSAVAAEQRKRGESKDAPRFDAAECPPRASCPILASSQDVTLLAEGTDAVRAAVLRSTRARGPPASRT